MMEKIIFKLIPYTLIGVISFCFILLVAGIGFLITCEYLTRDTYHEFMEECINEGNDFRFCLDQRN